MNEEYSYIKDAFTKVGDKTNLEVNNLNIDCLTSKNQKFELDSEGNLTVKSIVAETREVNQFTVNSLLANTISSNDNKFNLDNEGNLTVKSIIVENGIRPADILNTVYPVGSIYLSVNATNPMTLFGGSWEQIKDRFLLGCGDTYANGTIGGEETHVLSAAEMPTHTHAITTTGGHSHNAHFKEHRIPTGYQNTSDYARKSGASYDTDGQVTISDGAHTHGISSTGSSLAHNNMPPYLTVYMWKRIQ